MNVKIDTKEKFVVITPTETKLSVIMTAELAEMMLSYIQKDIPHVVLNLKDVMEIDEAACKILADVQHKFYEANCSCVICGLQKIVEDSLDELGILELLNVTPSESEAWDIVQMEEIEREILGDD